MMKRCLTLLLTVAVLCSCMAVTVGAAETHPMQQQLNVLEFDTVNGSGNYYMRGSNGKASAVFKLPYGTLVRYIDMYISTPSKSFDSISWVINGTSYPLTVEEVYGSTYYRVYGRVSGGYTNQIRIDFDWADNGSNYIQFYSLHVSAQTFSAISAPSTLTLDTYRQQSVTQSTGTSSVKLTDVAGSEANGRPISVSDYLVGVHNSDWQKYDYMNFTVLVYAATVNSVMCSIGNQQIPIELNFVEGDIPSYDSYWVEDGTGENRVFYDINVRVDLTGVNRTLTDELVFTVAGTSGSISCALYDSRGYTIADLPDAETTWLQKIWLGIQDLISAIRGDDSAADDFNDQLQAEVDKLEQDQEIIESMTTPDLEGIVGEVDINADAGDGIVFISGIFNSLWSSPLSLVFMYSGIFALIAYLLFGRRR